MNFTCSNEKFLRNVVGDLLRNYEKDSTVNISYEVVKKAKTLKQLGFIFGGLIKAISRYFDGLGYSFPPYVLKCWLYKECGVYKTETLPNGETFDSSKTLSEMTKQEASKFIEDVIYFIDSSDIFSEFVLPPDLRYCWTHNVDAEKLQKIKERPFGNFDGSFLLHQAKLTCIRCGARGGMVYHLPRAQKRDLLSLPLCAHCFDYADTHGETALIRDIKGILNGLSIEDFCLYAYYLYRKN